MGLLVLEILNLFKSLTKGKSFWYFLLGLYVFTVQIKLDFDVRNRNHLPHRSFTVRKDLFVSTLNPRLTV